MHKINNKKHELVGTTNSKDQYNSTLTAALLLCSLLRDTVLGILGNDGVFPEDVGHLL